MRTTLQLLSAVNNLYSLNLTDSQVNNFQRTADAEHWKDIDLEGSLWHFSLTDTILAYRNVNDMREIQLQKVPTKTSNRKISMITAMQEHKLSSCYLYTGGKRYDVPDPKHGFILKSLDKISIDELKLLDLFDNTLNDRNCKCLGIDVINTIGQGLKIYKKHLLANLDAFNKSDSCGVPDLKPLGNLIQYLWPNISQEIIKNDEITTTQSNILGRHSEMGLMVYIGEADNHRFIIMKHSDSSRSSYYYSRRHYEEHSFFIIPHTHSAYDYCDLGRFVFLDGTSYELCVGKHFFLDSEPAIPEKSEILKECARTKNITADQIGIYTNTELTHSVKRFMHRESRLKRESEAQERLQKKASDKIQILKEKDGELKINDMIFNSTSITYQGQELNITPDASNDLLTNWTYLIVKYLTRYQSISDIYFDTVMQAFVKLVTQAIIDKKCEVSGKIGDVTFAVTHQESTNSRNITSIRWYVNEKRINAKELSSVLERALCFENQVDYDAFLKSVSTCSLFFHRYLQMGIDIAVTDRFDCTEITMKFPLERRKGKMYLVLGEAEFAVADTHKLIRLSKKTDILEVITVLLDGSAVYDVQADDIRQLILDGKQAYVDAIEKSKLLLKETEELFNIKAETTQVAGKSKYGYLIKGNMRTYFLEKPDVNAEETSRSCGVYDFHSGQYICIVDKSTSQVGQDKLVNRLFALHNDSRVAKHINTLTSKK